MRLASKSIAVRLTVGLGLIALIVFGAAGVVLRSALDQALTHVDRLELRGKLGVVRHLIASVWRFPCVDRQLKKRQPLDPDPAR